MLLVVLTAAISLPGDGVQAAGGQKRVLVVYSTRRNSRIAVVGDRDLPEWLRNGLGEEVDYYSEHLDASRFPDRAYKEAFSDFLATKYRDRRFDVVIAMQDLVLDFLDASRSALFQDTPVVYFASSPATIRRANSTGVIAEVNLADTVTLASELQPDLRQVFVVSGAQRGDRAYEALARAQLRAFQPRLTVTYLAALPTPELEARLAALPAQSMVLFLTVTGDGAGDNFQPLDYVDRVTAVANAPTYSWVDSAMNHGIVGGSLKQQEAETAAVGKLAVRVLKGESADAIPVSTSDLNVRQVDWRQLRRWGIDEARVPANTLVRYREPTAWDRYKRYIVSAAALVLAEAALIAGLLVQADRRRHAEQQLRSSQERLRASYERVRDLGRRLLAAQEEENSRLARELHDDVSQQLTVLALDLQLLRRDSDRPSETERLTSQALERAEAVATSMRQLSHRLHPANLRLIGLVPALARLQADLSTAATAITFSQENVPGGIPSDVALCLFRVAQEALHNAVKHSGASAVSVHLKGDQDRLVLTISDEGRGFDVDAARPGLGLISMEERVAQVGGSLRIHSTPGGGTQLEVIAPAATVHAMEAGVM